MAQRFLLVALRLTFTALAVVVAAGGLCAQERPVVQPLPQTPIRDVTAPAVGITLSDALRIATLSNIDVNLARQVVVQAQASRLRAQSLALPNLSFAPSYVHHDGRLQKNEGNILDVNRDSLFVGGGPSLSLGLSDALFSNVVARDLLRAAEAGQRRVTNDTLLTVADAYFSVLRARRRVARIDEVLDFLVSEQKRDLRGDSIGMLPLIRAFVQTGAALPADQARVEVEVLRRRDELIAALQELRLATAELARLLHLDPTVLLWPLEDYRVPIDVPGAAWCEQDLVVLVAWALTNRPELAENQALARAALARVRTAYWRPVLPTVVVNYSAGGFGGSPQLETSPSGASIFGRSGRITRFGNRDDFDVTLVWRLQNMGLGNIAEQRETRSLHEQALLRQVQTQDRVVAQVVQAQESVLRSRERVQLSRSSLYDSAGAPAGLAYQSVLLNFTRIKGGEGRPLEVLDSIRSLNDLLDSYAAALTDFERARFRLLVTLGMPSQGLLDPRCLPPPPAAPAPPPSSPPSDRPTELPPPRPLSKP